MTASNHLLTGSLLASIVPHPLLGLPLAFASHFLLDALPHYGEAFGRRGRLFRIIVAVDAVLVLLVTLLLVQQNAWLMLSMGFVAMSPDIAWVYRFVVAEQWGRITPRPANRFNSWHASIQSRESRFGVIYEIVYFMSLSLLLWRAI